MLPSVAGAGGGLFPIGEYSGTTHADWLEPVLLKGRHRQTHLVWNIYHSYWCCKQKNIQKRKVRQTVSRTSPIGLNVAFSIGWSRAETKTNVLKMGVKLIQYIREDPLPQCKIISER